MNLYRGRHRRTLGFLDSMNYDAGTPTRPHMEFSLPVSLGALLVIVVIGVAGLAGSGVMPLETTLMMVAPSMLAFGFIAFALGMKHGEFRAGSVR